jgi:excisionase family DNA binding protein
MYSTTETAELLSVSPTTVFRWVTAGYLPAINIGEPGKRPKIRISEDDLQRFIEKRTVRVTA